jgi:hypothetical protein
VFERGFLSALTIEAEALAAHAEDIFRNNPIRNLRLLEARGHLGKLVWKPELAGLVGLDLSACRIGDQGLELLSLSCYLSSLTDLDLRRNDIGPVGARALAQSPHLRHLRQLDLSWNRLGGAGCAELGRWPALDGLMRLDLTRNEPSCRPATILRERLGMRVSVYG